MIKNLKTYFFFTISNLIARSGVRGITFYTILFTLYGITLRLVYDPTQRLLSPFKLLYTDGGV